MGSDDANIRKHRQVVFCSGPRKAPSLAPQRSWPHAQIFYSICIPHLQVLFSMHTYYAASTNIVHDIPHLLAPVTLHPAPLGARDTVMPQRLAPVILFTSTVGAVTPYTSTFGARDTLYLNYSCP